MHKGAIHKHQHQRRTQNTTWISQMLLCLQWNRYVSKNISIWLWNIQQVWPTSKATGLGKLYTIWGDWCAKLHFGKGRLRFCMTNLEGYASLSFSAAARRQWHLLMRYFKCNPTETSEYQRLQWRWEFPAILLHQAILFEVLLHLSFYMKGHSA